VLLTDLFSEYVAENSDIRSKRTRALYLIALQHFSNSLRRPATIADLNEKAMKAFLIFREGEDVADSTYSNEAIKIMAVWRWAASRHYCEAPRIRITRQPPPTPKAMLQDQIRALFAAAAEYKRTVGGVPGSLLFPAILGVIWESAERIGAVHALKRSDIDIARREVTFRKRKGRGRVLRKSISKATASALSALLADLSLRDAAAIATLRQTLGREPTRDEIAEAGANQSETPFAPVAVPTLYHHLDAITVAAGLPVEKGQKFHALRKSHASYLVAAGGDARASLDHSSFEITNAHYIDPTVANKRQPVDLLFSPFSLWQRLFYWLRRVRTSVGM
jgi:integrase